MQDLTTQLNAGDRTIARLQKQLARSAPSPRATAFAQRSRRSPHTSCGSSAQQAATSAPPTTPPSSCTSRHRRAAVPSHHNGPLHGLGVAFHWIWIGAVYAFALGAPLVLLVGLAWFVARLIRRRRVDALLSRP